MIKSVLKKTFVGKIYRYWRRNQYINSVIKKFLGNNVNRLRKKELRKDMLWMEKQYLFSSEEFLLYNFEHLSLEERLKFVSDRERIDYCKKINNENAMAVFNDKGVTYQYFKQFYKRDLLKINSSKDFDLFQRFVARYPKFIVKPHDMYMGLGVKIVDLSGAVLKQAFDSLQSDYENGFVMEELVAQSNEIGRFHPQSVNTVRVPTVNYGDRIEIIHPFFRIGKGDSVVDNAGSGGIMVLVDVETGKTISKARDEHGHEYVKHPNTGYDLVGVQLPKWGEAIQLVKQLASVLPENKYTSWDLAYTDEHGWIMIEGNAKGQFVWQIVSRIGFKDEIEQIVAELNTERGSADAN